MSVNGIDVASYQSSTYATAGLDFVLVKATEGTNYINPRHTAQVAHGREHNLVVGHYHFVRPGSMTAQVAYFLQHAAAAPGDILALDWEDTEVSGTDKDAFLHAAQARAPHQRVILYCNLDFWRHRDTTSFAGDGLWIADPGGAAGHPRIQHPWTFHQYSERAGLDRDVANFPSTAALRAWAARTNTPTPEDTMPTPADYAAAVVKALTGPAARDTLAVATFYWLRYLLDPSLPLPTGKNTPAIASQVAELRPVVAQILAKLAAPAPALTDEQAAQIAAALGADETFARNVAAAFDADFAAHFTS